MIPRLLLVACTVGVLAFLSVPCLAQGDTVEFKFIPKYSPDEKAHTDAMPPELLHKPDITFPADPELAGRAVKVWVKVLVDTSGVVRDARVLKSTDRRFDRYALRYARQYTFRWRDPHTIRDPVWVALPIRFDP